MVAGVILAVLFLVMGICLWNGKGAWLIAGFNTMSPKERERYDKKRMCKAVGVLCMICCVMICALLYMGHLVDSGVLEEKTMGDFALVFVAVILLTVILTGWYVNTRAKKK